MIPFYYLKSTYMYKYLYINTLKLIVMLVKLKALKHFICTWSGSMYARQSGRGSGVRTLWETLSGDMNMDKIHTVFITLPKIDSLFTLVTH